jgi:hypothetical protein
MAEYIASFWNPEAVRQIKSSRDVYDTKNFASDEKFEQQLKEKDFKNNKYVDAIIKLRNQREDVDTNNYQDNKEVNYSGIKLPTNLKFIKDY